MRRAPRSVAFDVTPAFDCGAVAVAATDAGAPYASAATSAAPIQIFMIAPPRRCTQIASRGPSPQARNRRRLVAVSRSGPLEEVVMTSGMGQRIAALALAATSIVLTSDAALASQGP